MARVKQKVEFQTFLDGLCSFWQLDKNKKPVKVMDHIHFQNRVVGIKRNYLAEQSGHTVQRLIRIPWLGLKAHGTFVVIGSDQYVIHQAQRIYDSVPQCLQLTLVQPDILLNFDQEVTGTGGRL